MSDDPAEEAWIAKVTPLEDRCPYCRPAEDDICEFHRGYEEGLVAGLEEGIALGEKLNEH